MTISVKHAFTSLKGDGGDATLVRPSNWNAEHTKTMAGGNIIGRLTAGNGAWEEIPISAYMADLLGSADAAALAGKIGLFETGDVKYTFKTTAPAGWVLILGGTGAYGNTIGKTGSGAVSRSADDCLALFTLIYNNCSDAIAPVSGGRSGNATTDFNAGKTIRVPNLVGRSPIGAGGATNDGTIARVLGTLYGNETATLVTANLPPYTPSGSITLTMNPLVNALDTLASSTTGGGAFGFNYVSNQTSPTPTGTASFNGSPQGGTSTPVGIIHPTVALNAMVKL